MPTDNWLARRRFGLGLRHLLIAFCVVFVIAQPTAAQVGSYPCAGGAGPGERQVGYQEAGIGIAGYAICVRDEPEGPAPPPRPAMLPINNYHAAAWQDLSSNVWMSAGYGSPADAESAAVDACNLDMGGGCVVAVSSVNGGLSVARGSTGTLFAAGMPTARAAENEVLGNCQKKNDFCVVINGLTAMPGSHAAGTSVNRKKETFRPKGDFRKMYGAVASGSDPSDPQNVNTLYIATGYRLEEEAGQKAVEACIKQGSGGCAVASIISDAFFIAVKRSDNLIAIASSPSKKLAVKIVKETCLKTIKCTITAIIPAWQGGIIKHQPLTDPR